MLRIYEDVLIWHEWIEPILERVRERNTNLAAQLDRASTSVAANLCEGWGAEGKSKRRAYRIALGEMHESIGLLTLAARKRYVESPDESMTDRMQKITATLIKLAKPGQK